jgi:UPF0271 protein
MDPTVRLEQTRGVDVGAHMGFPDWQGLGRVIQNEPAHLDAIVIYQLGALAGIACAACHRMAHMSFHGARGKMVVADADLAARLVAAVARFDPALTILSSPSHAIETAAQACGLKVATAFLADRACHRDDLLVRGDTPGAVGLSRGLRERVTAEGWRVTPVSMLSGFPRCV